MSCFKCGSQGHLRRACPEKGAAGSGAQEEGLGIGGQAEPEEGTGPRAGPDPESERLADGAGEQTGEDVPGTVPRQETEERPEMEASEQGGTSSGEADSVGGSGIVDGVDAADNPDKGVPNQQMKRQEQEAEKSEEISDRPVHDPGVQVGLGLGLAVPDEEEWGREGTEADPDEEMSSDEEGQFSEFSQADETGSCVKALRSGVMLHAFIRGGVKKMGDLVKL
ncbi:hypothetical protein SKAU_G00181390 [Synaphobranchus kaupii]|uniref:CCHC-type domain-containing protein n=1 Tax=Synaphobranchus kaupii TaxID=118154 RepID=A0A9Q1FN08_SYNKA|nr:hypothetical protein SKAU_G00181390 [Synaphobranchus kaupii]